MTNSGLHNRDAELSPIVKSLEKVVCVSFKFSATSQWCPGFLHLFTQLTLAYWHFVLMFIVPQSLNGCYSPRHFIHIWSKIERLDENELTSKIILWIKQHKLLQKPPRIFHLHLTNISCIAILDMLPDLLCSLPHLFKVLNSILICIYLFLDCLPSLECKLHKSITFLCFVHGDVLSM